MSPETLDSAIHMIRQGQKKEARKLLEGLLRQDTHNLPAWFWYVETLPDEAQRIQALEFCLKQNPGSTQAKAALQALLTHQVIAQHPPVTPSSGPQTTQVAPAVAQPQPPPAPLPPPDPSEQVKAIVARYQPRIRDNYIFFAPNIPAKKLRNVLESYAMGARREQILLLIDNTAFGSAKDGALVTDQRFFAHNVAEQPFVISLNKIRTAYFVEGMTSKLYFNDLKALEINLPDRRSLHVLTEMFREIIGLFNPAEQATTPVEALAKLKQLLEAGLITESEFQAKRQQILDKL